MSLKMLYVDTETTGTDSKKNGILTLSGIIEIDGEIKEEFDYKMKPFPQDIIDDKALEINRITREQIMSFEEPQVVYRKFVSMLDKYIDKYNKESKLYLVGQNTSFDRDMIYNFFYKNGNKYPYAYFMYHLVDLVTTSILFKLAGLYNFPNCKLETVAKELGMNADFHNSLDDIRCTRDIFHYYINKIKECQCEKLQNNL